MGGECDESSGASCEWSKAREPLRRSVSFSNHIETTTYNPGTAVSNMTVTLKSKRRRQRKRERKVQRQRCHSTGSECSSDDYETKPVNKQNGSSKHSNGDRKMADGKRGDKLSFMKNTDHSAAVKFSEFTDGKPGANAKSDGNSIGIDTNSEKCNGGDIIECDTAHDTDGQDLCGGTSETSVPKSPIRFDESPIPENGASDDQPIEEPILPKNQKSDEEIVESSVREKNLHNQSGTVKTEDSGKREVHQNQSEIPSGKSRKQKRQGLTLINTVMYELDLE